ncbi:TRAP transporter substrate-binding protein [Pararhodobacter oceanensis]|uniref:ABC transporter substrate-binding protein n=1 Tax=Pararhodobacter oceanensis TaxID=2172121 RepID=A0A2T8HSM8_9RHOB|nr:TRAP transporter substrate-binding protein [Pararhodobacter oceanensis]PVH28450.1 ABC transporter substrate-binding protein [Pararhodobacter oceanensis]
MKFFSKLTAATALVSAMAVVPAVAAEFEFKFANVEAPQSIGGQATQAFANCVQEGSNERINITIFPSGALGNQTDNLESIRTNLIDFTQVVSPIVTVDPLLSVFTLPYIFRDRDHVDRVMHGPVGSFVAERLAARNVIAIGYWEGGFRQITNNVRPIHTPADLEGIKLRTPSDLSRIMLFQSLGANASALPWSEVYSALQTGVYDGQENPALYVEDANLFEVQNYLSFTSHVYGVSYLVMSEQAYDSLPQDLRVVVRECGRISGEESVAYGAQADAEAEERAIARGMEVNTADVAAFMAAAQPLHMEMISNTMSDEDAETARALLTSIQNTH